MSISPSFDLLMSVTASTKRADYDTGTMVANLTGVAIHPLSPVDPEVRKLLNLSAHHGELLQTFTRETDIQEGDVLTVDSTDYPVRSVADYPWRPTSAHRLVVIVEQPKTSSS